MKGVILAGGNGTRLSPLTKATNKCLLPVGRKPMILRVLEQLLAANIKDVMLVTSSDHVGHIVSLLGSGVEYGCRLTYRIQDSANGIAAALSLAEDFVGKDRFAVLLGDNIFENSKDLADQIRKFGTSFLDDYCLFVKEVPDPQRFGVPVYLDGRLVDVVEKPSIPPSNDAIVGLYLYNGSTVFPIIKELKPSDRGEYEISDVNRELIANWRGSHKRIEGRWIDAGTFETLRLANEMVGDT